MNLGSTTLRYARALFETAREMARLDEVTEDLDVVAQLLRELPDAVRFCDATGHAPEAREEFVHLAFAPYVGELTHRVLEVIAANDRLAVIPLLQDGFSRLRRESADIVEVVVETVEPADAELVDRVKSQMERRLGQQVEVRNLPNPDLVAGMRVLWLDRLLDDSVAARVRSMKRQLAIVN